MASNTNKKCAFCANSNSPYCCPRCGSSYCSTACYQNVEHLSCSESFYKEWIEVSSEELQGDKQESARKMYDILKRMKNDRDLDSDDEDTDGNLVDLNFLETKLEEIDLNNIDDIDGLWAELTPEEQEKVKERLEIENLEEIFLTWEPWWQMKRQKKLVEEVNTSGIPISEKANSEVPPIPKLIVPLEKLTKVKPSTTVVFDMINILVSYVYMTRKYNGDYAETAFETVPLFLKISGVLSCSKKFGSLSEAIFDLQNEALKSQGLGLSREEIVLTMHDISKILEGSNNCADYLLAAMSDLISLLLVYKRNFKINTESQIVPTKVISLSIKRLEYYLSYIVSTDQNLFRKLVPEIQLLIANIVEDETSLQQTVTKPEAKAQRVLIEEI